MDNKKKVRGVIEAQQLKRSVNADPVLKKCADCGSVMEGRHQNYEYKECGLPNVVLVGVLVFHCHCGEIRVQIPAASVLHRVIALELIKKPSLLAGDEVRFLRKHVGCSATELADILGATKVSMSRWETGAGRITKNTDRVLRLAFFMAMVERDAEVAVGPNDSTQVRDVLAFAKDVQSFNLTSFLKRIRDVHEQSSIKIDPQRLAEMSLAPLPACTSDTSLVN